MNIHYIFLSDCLQLVFNFNAGVGVSKGAGGSITTANAADFPAVIGNGMAMAVGVMGKYKIPLQNLSRADRIFVCQSKL
jgi:hypothetical protein